MKSILIFLITLNSLAGFKIDLSQIETDIRTKGPTQIQNKSYIVNHNYNNDLNLSITPKEAFEILKDSKNSFRVTIINPKKLYYLLTNDDASIYYPRYSNGNLTYNMIANTQKNSSKCIVEVPVVINGETVYLKDEQLNFDLTFDKKRLRFLNVEKSSLVFERLAPGYATVDGKITSKNNLDYSETFTTLPLPECDRSQRPVDGNWGDWIKAGNCSQTCGTGQQAYLRKCDNPAPVNNGRHCIGNKVRLRDCKIKSCSTTKIALTETQMQRLRRNMSFGLGSSVNIRGRSMKKTNYTINIRELFGKNTFCDVSVRSGYFQNRKKQRNYSSLDSNHHYNIFIPADSSTLVTGEIKMKKNDTYWVKNWINGFWLQNCVHEI